MKVLKLQETCRSIQSSKRLRKHPTINEFLEGKINTEMFHVFCHMQTKFCFPPKPIQSYPINLCSDSWTASSRFCRKKSSDPIEVPRCIVSQSMCSSVWYKPHLARPLPGRYPKIAVYGLLFPPHMINLWIPICG